MFVGYDITLKEMKDINPVAVSDVKPAKLCAPKPIAWLSDEPDIIRAFKAYSVDVIYPGDLIGSGNVKRKLTFNPKLKVGQAMYAPKQNVTKITYLFGFNDQFFAEDAYFKASQFAGIMACRVAKGKDK